MAKIKKLKIVSIDKDTDQLELSYWWEHKLAHTFWNRIYMQY